MSFEKETNVCTTERLRVIHEQFYKLASGDPWKRHADGTLSDSAPIDDTKNTDQALTMSVADTKDTKTDSKSTSVIKEAAFYASETRKERTDFLSSPICRSWVMDRTNACLQRLHPQLYPMTKTKTTSPIAFWSPIGWCVIVIMTVVTVELVYSLWHTKPTLILDAEMDRVILEYLTKPESGHET